MCPREVQAGSVSPVHPEDYRLAQAVLSGDQASAERLFDLYFDRLYRFVYYRSGGDHHDAEEITQATMAALVPALAGYKGDSRLFTWICSVARHKLSDLMRASRRDPAVASVEELSEVLEQLSRGRDDQSPVEDSLHRKELRNLVGATLAALPEGYRQALRWRYYDKLSLESMAERLGKGTKAVESILTRAKAAFRTEWRIQSGEVISVRRGRGGP